MKGIWERSLTDSIGLGSRRRLIWKRTDSDGRDRPQVGRSRYSS